MGSPAGHTYFTYRTACGPLTLAAASDALVRVVPGEVALAGEKRAVALTNNAATQIMEYLAGKRTVFDIPFRIEEGTPFQRRAWRALGAIPYGQVRTAADVAAAMDAPDSFRAVGSALKKNPLPLLIPAHRIVTARGPIEGSDALSALYRACLQIERRFA